MPSKEITVKNTRVKIGNFDHSVTVLNGKNMCVTVTQTGKVIIACGAPERSFILIEDGGPGQYMPKVSIHNQTMEWGEAELTLKKPK